MVGDQMTAKLGSLEEDARSLLFGNPWLCRNNHCNLLYGIVGGLAWCKFAHPGVSVKYMASSMGLVVPVGIPQGVPL